MTRSEQAKNYFYEGYACSQALVMAFKDLVNVDEETLKTIALPFGGGIGRLRLTCGAFSGMIIITSLIFSNNNNSIEENKTNVYAIVQELSNRFEKTFETKSCLELLKRVENVETGGKPETRNEQYYVKRPCANIVYKSAEILEQYLIEQKILLK